MLYAGKSVAATIMRLMDHPELLEKAKEELGWEAVRGLDEMCEDSWRWQSSNPNGYEG